MTTVLATSLDSIFISPGVTADWQSRAHGDELGH